MKDLGVKRVVLGYAERDSAQRRVALALDFAVKAIHVNVRHHARLHQRNLR